MNQEEYILNMRRKVEVKKEILRKKHPKLWLAREHHLNVHNKRLSFGDKYRFLIELYRNFPEVAAIEKCVQVGVTELLIVSTFDEAGRGLRILYVMPNTDLRNKFVKDRVDRLIKVVPYYTQQVKSAIGSSESIGLKHFGPGLLNYVGSNSPVEFISYAADSLYVDEQDKCDQVNVEMAPDRLDGSDYKYDRRVGNPSVENWGIDYYYQDSTQGVWVIKCDHCGRKGYQVLDFFKNVVIQTGNLTYDVIAKDGNCVCRRCHRPIDRFKMGEYVDKYRDRERVGRKVSQLFSANTTVGKLVDTYDKALGNSTKMQLFYNSKLGLTYSDSSNKITLSLLEKATKKLRYTINSDSIVTGPGSRVHIGIDVGPVYYHVIARELIKGGHRKLVFADRISKTEDLINFLKYKIKFSVAIIDQEPETRNVEDIKKEIKKMLSCDYHYGKTLLSIRKEEKKYKRERKVAIDRTFILDSVKSDFAKGIMVNPVNSRDIDNVDMEEYGMYYAQMISSSRIFDENAGREKKGRFVWRESGADHYFHAEAYCKLAELLDPKVMNYYADKVAEYSRHTKEEIEAMEREKRPFLPEVKKKEIIDEKGNKKVIVENMEELEMYTPDRFLRNLYDHTRGILNSYKK